MNIRFCFDSDKAVIEIERVLNQSKLLWCFSRLIDSDDILLIIEGEEYRFVINNDFNKEIKDLMLYIRLRKMFQKAVNNYLINQQEQEADLIKGFVLYRSPEGVVLFYEEPVFGVYNSRTGDGDVYENLSLAYLNGIRNNIFQNNE